MDTHDQYLGDGVYASFDGYHIWLDLRAQDPTIRIGLEPSVMRKLRQYDDMIDDKMQEHISQMEATSDE